MLRIGKSGHIVLGAYVGLFVRLNVCPQIFIVPVTLDLFKALGSYSVDSLTGSST